jgi:hypothetical protein
MPGSHATSPTPSGPRANDITQDIIDAFPYGNLDDFTYVGLHHWFRFTWCDKSYSCPGEVEDLPELLRTADDEGHYLHGIIQPHLRYSVDGVQTWCGGGVTFRGHGTKNGAQWDVRSLDPLTLEPSLLCRAPITFDNNHMPTSECNDHGYITDGLWVAV